MTRRMRSRAEWLQICAASYASGLTIRAFAERMELNAKTLSWWRSELREELTSGVERPSFVEVSALAQETSCSLVLDVGDVQLRFSSLPPSAWLSEVLSRC